MFEYFPDNYSWSLSVHMALNMGGEISEIDELATPLKPLASNGEQHASEWFDAWVGMADRLERLADEDEEAGRTSAAGRKLLRAVAYLMIGERQIMDKSEATQAAYRRANELFMRGATGYGFDVERVEVPLGDKAMPALFLRAYGDDAPAPAIIHFSGLDVNKEIIFLQHVRDLPRYGVSVLICDHPGVGESLRFRELYATHASEIPASACVDYLEGRSDVDSERIGIQALSLGGYYAPRAAAFEPRLKCCSLWGAIWDVPALLEWVRTQNGAVSVPLDVQFQWVMGADSIAATHEQLADWKLEGVMDRIRCPILTLHGANDQQAPLIFAQKTHDAAVNSSRRELKVFQPDEGGVEHCQGDNVTMGTDYLFSWIADVLGADPSGRQRPSGVLVSPDR